MQRYEVTCNQCNTKIAIVNVSPAGKIIGYEEERGIMAARMRLDGELGFQCMCGNDSRLAEAERGIVKGTRPSKSDVAEIYRRMKAKPTKVSKSGSQKRCDGFTTKLMVIDDRRVKHGSA